MALRFSKGQIVRLTVALAIVVIAIWQLAPLTVSDIRPNGVVNAKLVTIQAPISGQLVRAIPDVGEPVSAGSIVTRITDDTEPQALLAQLDGEYQLLRSRKTALIEKLSTLNGLRRELGERVREMVTGSMESLHYKMLEAAARQKGWMSVVKERDLSLARQKTLLADGHVAKARVEEAESLLEQAQQEVERARADEERYRKESGALEKGVFVGDGQNDVPYSQQRLDEVVLAIADLNVQLTETNGRMASLEKQLRDESARAGRRESMLVRSPIDGLIWRRMATELATVTKNNDLAKILDCSDVRIEVPVDESLSDRMEIGAVVSVRLQGSPETFEGIISGVIGTRAVSPELEYAALPPLLKKDEVLLVVNIPESGFEDRPETFCNVGRRAEVSIPSRLHSWFGESDPS
ncbi:MAG: HlyD family efflux transporter periplasmic adaptor subunit [Thalassospira sp.]|uniref:HlyD family secretion protein n=1 Tax=Thalassospira sp. TaxID=1912094 RepID=UPI001B15877D|nr:HlyD family efflux transporter periplasmic adaptor subunit [Thalassospira sp.]MBO6580277.1 HlyD family efflux transporter periplasmic adaptor subunit [Thalassospira sp.]MBO6803697.1 HlyD family efflux transporter periplasmic adaptor subunit [Thalassospira sp.]MBO6820174.1 HlyD family efflux transporter periplasmic adaptor subunit [Thalassospira sp.]MBO6889231.1 HlyD family efflux transporter periplasmic adaptor subunit [Thalassospira sp.]